MRFICVGLFNTMLDFLMFNFLAFMVHLPVLVANTISVCVGVVVSYFLNHSFVFKYHKSPSLKSFLKFFVVTGMSVLIVQTIVIAVMTPLYSSIVSMLLPKISSNPMAINQQQIAVNLAKISAVCVGMFWNFFFYSKTIFNTTKK